MNNNTEEVWKDIDGFLGYQVSNMGNVRSLNFNRSKHIGILKGSIHPSGYLQVSLRKDRKCYSRTIHTLVWDNFSEIPRKGRKIIPDHINNNKLDNRFCNLQLLTSRENTTKERLLWNTTSKFTGVYWYPRDKKWRSQITINGKRKHLGYFNNEIDASNAYQNKLKEINEINEKENN